MTIPDNSFNSPVSAHRKQIFIVEDHPVMLDGLANLVNRQPDLEAKWQCTFPDDALSLLSTVNPDLLMTDLSMPGKSGPDFIKEALALHPDLPILVLSMHDEALYAERLMRMGVKGYIMKDAGVNLLLEAVRQVLSGGIYLSPQISSRILTELFCPSGEESQSPLARLTCRELQVFQLIGQGKNTGDIAKTLGTSPKTVDVHRAHIREKLELPDMTALIRYAVCSVESDGVNKQ